jgi:hypothetical protein
MIDLTAQPDDTARTIKRLIRTQMLLSAAEALFTSGCLLAESRPVYATASDRNGIPVDHHSPHAVAWSPAGAILAVAGRDNDPEALTLIRRFHAARSILLPGVQIDELTYAQITSLFAAITQTLTSELDARLPA